MKKINPNKLPKSRPDGRPYAETRGSDPDGNYFDISGTWLFGRRAFERKTEQLASWIANTFSVQFHGGVGSL